MEENELIMQKQRKKYEELKLKTNKKENLS